MDHPPPPASSARAYTPQAMANELQIPVETVLKHLRGIGFPEETGPDTPFKPEDYASILARVKRREAHLKSRALHGTSVEHILETPGATLWKLPGVFLVMSTFDPDLKDEVIVVGISRKPSDGTTPPETLGDYKVRYEIGGHPKSST